MSRDVAQKHTGRHQLIDRLSSQVGSKEKAMGLLKKYGYVDNSGNLTEAGKARDAMTASERAKDRAAKATGKKPSLFKYNKKTNRATLRG